MRILLFGAAWPAARITVSDKTAASPAGWMIGGLPRRDPGNSVREMILSIRLGIPARTCRRG